MIKVSVVLATCRLGGMDLLVNSFAQQTLPKDEFELVVVDEYYNERKDLLARVDLPLKHLPNPPSDVYNNTSGFNAALRAATGELVAFLVDFCWVYPAYLETHWRWYQRYPGTTMTGYVDRYAPPPVRLNGRQMWSVFEPEFTAEYASRFFNNASPEYRERKGFQFGAEHQPGVREMPGDLIYLLGDTVPLRVLKALNGLDQQYDGGYGSNDIDLGVRANLFGHKFLLNPQSIIIKLGTPSSSQGLPGVNRPRLRTPEENYQLYVRRMAAIKAGVEPLRVPSGRGCWE